MNTDNNKCLGCGTTRDVVFLPIPNAFVCNKCRVEFIIGGMDKDFMSKVKFL